MALTYAASQKILSGGLKYWLVNLGHELVTWGALGKCIYGFG